MTAGSLCCNWEEMKEIVGPEGSAPQSNHVSGAPVEPGKDRRDRRRRAGTVRLFQSYPARLRLHGLAVTMQLK
jgi:hypothetical protein